MNELDGLKRFVPRNLRHQSWAGLPHVRTVRAKGRTYLYFNTGLREARSYVRLPEPDTTDFSVAYRAMFDARQKRESAAFAAAEALKRHEAKRRFVYFIGGDVGAVKIGYAKQPQHRLREIQIGSPLELSILALREGGSKLEREYHHRFAAHRLHGEWFERHPDILAEIDRLNERPARQASSEALTTDSGGSDG